MSNARSIREEPIPAALSWAYQASLNHQTDLLFWVETNYKPMQRLDPNDPRDRAMIPAWYSARARIAQESSPRKLIRDRAIEAATDFHARDPQLALVHAAGAGGSETRAFSSLRDPQTEQYVRARLRDSAYVAIFNAADERWPQPIYENYPGDRAPLNVSGDLPRGYYGRRRKGA